MWIENEVLNYYFKNWKISYYKLVIYQLLKTLLSIIVCHIRYYAPYIVCNNILLCFMKRLSKVLYYT